MNKIQSNFSLLKYNTFNLEIKSKYFYQYNNYEEIIDFLNKFYLNIDNYYVLGGGSNSLFTKNFEGYIIHPNNKGIKIIEENNNSIILKIEAGEEWDSIVKYCVDNNYYGIENLSLIPGSCGAAPIQNIGAYGTEVKDVIKEVEFINLSNNKIEKLNNIECKFDYRNSIFKNDLKGKIIILNITIELNKKETYNLTYGNLKEEFENSNNKNLKRVRDIIIKTRQSKLPDYKIIGNAGSFFKNPIISNKVLQKIKESYPNIPTFPNAENEFKIPAGWLIETAGFKGYRKGNVGVYDKQALVLVNYNNCKPNELISLANEIIETIDNKFGILLSPEVNII